MRRALLMVLLTGCITEQSLEESDAVSLRVGSTKVTVDASSSYCVELPESLHGAANGHRMTVITRGDEHSVGGGGGLDLGDTDGDGDSFEWEEGSGQSTTICDPAELAMPVALRDHRDDVVIEIADHSGTFTAIYPELFTPLRLTFVAAEIVDDRFVATWTASPSRQLGQASVHVISERGEYGWYESNFRITVEDDTIRVVFPDRSEILDARYGLKVGSTVVPTACDGFSRCESYWGTTPNEIDPAIVDMALLPVLEP
jgi:hypothetical protein